jgi:hypothetical protein
MSNREEEVLMSWVEEKRYYRWIILVACMLVYCTSQLVRWNYASITISMLLVIALAIPRKRRSV